MTTATKIAGRNSGIEATISLCMIVRNEERYIGACMSSVAPFVDEIIVVDTGSQDRTIEIARSHGARVFSFPWTGSFSEARNQSISHATGDWILILDADECLARRDAELLRSLVRDTKARGIKLLQRTYLWNAGFVCSMPNPKNYDEGREYSDCVEVFVIRLFRSQPEIRYEGRVHELVEPVFAARKLPCDVSSVVIHHFGKVGDPADLERKKNLYLDLGFQKAREQADDAMAQFELGVQLFELHRYDECIPYFETANQLNQRFDISLLYIAKASHLSGRMDEARHHYRRCLQLGPENDKVLFEYANFVRDQGLLKTSLKIYQKTLAINPRHALAAFNIGGVYIRLGQIERGFNHIKKAIRLNPDNDVFHENFGRLALAGYGLDDAAHLLEDFLQRFPNAHGAAAVLGEVQFKLNHFESAAHWAGKAMESKPADLKLRMTKANAEFSLFRMDDATKSYEAVLCLDPSNLDCRMNLAAIAEHRGDLNAATRCYEQILDIHPGHPETLKRYSRLAAKSQPPSAAIPLLERARLANPEDTAILMLLASAYELGSCWDEAIALFRESQRRNPKLSRTADHKIARLMALKARRADETKQKEDRNVSA